MVQNMFEMYFYVVQKYPIMLRDINIYDHKQELASHVRSSIKYEYEKKGVVQ